MIVAFDCDGTLQTLEDKPNYHVIDLLRWFIANGDKIIIWSGGGHDYAERVARRLGLYDPKIRFMSKSMASMLPEDEKPQITVDDEGARMGLVNIKV